MHKYWELDAGIPYLFTFTSHKPSKARETTMFPFVSLLLLLTNVLAVSADLKSDLRGQGIACTFPGEADYATSSKACASSMTMLFYLNLTRESR
jgi:hypothetical protein